MKKYISAALGLCIVLSLLTVPSLAAADLETEVLPVLAVMGIMNGDARGDLGLARPVTRAEFTKMAVAASPYKAQGEAATVLSPYPDVKAGAWHSGYILTARDKGWVSGYLDGSFKPDSYVKLEEALSILLKAMGYGADDLAAGFPQAHMALYHALGLDDGMTARQGSPLTRLDCARLLYNTLNARTKSGNIYAVQLGYRVDATGKIDYASLTAALTEGPVLLESTVEAAVGFTPVVVHRDRRAAAYADLTVGDVLYYNADIGTVWAYSGKISGVVQSISPSTAAPSAVTVSGMTCALGSTAVIYQFSDLGTIHVGDTVTLRLGAGEQAVFVSTGEEISDTTYGVVTSVGTVSQNTTLGGTTQQRTLTMTATDGTVRTYPYPKGSLKVGSAVCVTTDSDGVSVKAVQKGAALSGKVRNGKLDGMILDNATKIIDYAGGRAVSITAERLENVSIRSGDLLWAKVEAGHIDHLILDDVTGDGYGYGIVTAAFESPDLMHTPSQYVLTVHGQPLQYTANAAYGIEEGPCAIEYKADGAIAGLRKLKQEKIDRLGSLSADLSKSGALTLSGDIQYYIERDDVYYLADRPTLESGDYTLTAYFDNTADNGGRVRVIVGR